MASNSVSNSFDLSSQRLQLPLCPCTTSYSIPLRLHHRYRETLVKSIRWPLFQVQCCGNPRHHLNYATRRAAQNIVLKRFEEETISSNDDIDSTNYYSTTTFGQDPIVDKLRNQLGVIHPIPSPPLNRDVFGLFAFFFFVGVVFDKLWMSRKKTGNTSGGKSSDTLPSGLSMLLEKDLQRKESVEWVNMVLGKLWKVYRGGLENWLIGLLQPVIDNLQKPDYVERVEIKQFSLGDEPLSVRSVERRTSRRANDLQYQIGIRYTGGARMLLLLSLKFGILPIVVPVGIRDFDIDGELWVKLRLIPTEPWVGAVSWAFVSLPKIKFELSPFRLFNLMAIPVLSMFLKKLLTEDLPRLFVRPKKIVLDFQKGKAVIPLSSDSKAVEGKVIASDSKAGDVQEGNSDFAGELSVTLLDARKLSYIFYGKTDPYVILRIGDQVIRSKRNSQTTVIGPPGQPIWNQDFHMLVANPKKQKLSIEVKDSLGFTDLTVGTAEVDLASLKDTVPTDKIVVLRGGWALFGNGSAGEILLRMTYKAYVEEDEDEKSEKSSTISELSRDELSKSDKSTAAASKQFTNGYVLETEKESFIDVLAALLVSEEFLGIMTSEPVKTKASSEDGDVNLSQVNDGVVGSFEQISEPRLNNSGGTILIWLAVITSISVLIALNMDGSSLFNP